MENERNPCVILGTLPCVRITTHNRAANSRLRTKRLIVSRTNDLRRVVERVLYFELKNAKQLVCVIQDVEPPKAKSI